MTQFLFSMHSGVRYLVLLAAVVAIIVALVRLKAGTIGEPGRIAGAAFTGLLDLQFLLGIAVLITRLLARAFYPALIGHIVMMILAITVAHATMGILRKRPPERRSPAFQLGGISLALLLIIGGIRAIGRAII